MYSDRGLGDDSKGAASTSPQSPKEILVFMAVCSNERPLPGN